MKQPPNGERLAAHLARRLTGDVAADERTLTRYSLDQSIYQITPLLVAFPETVDDVIEITRFAREEAIPLTARAGGTSTAGSALGRGILMVFARGSSLGRIVHFDDRAGEQIVTVEPALLHADLQAHLREHGRFLPADPSSANICLMGGNIATKASGPHALKHGSIDRYLKSLQFVTARGELVDTSDASSIPEYLRRGVEDIREQLLADGASSRRLQARMERKLASGYNLFTFLRHTSVSDWIAQLLVGSVGTLGIVTRAQLRTEPYEEGRATSLLYFRHLREAGDAVQHIKALGVAAIEIMNYRSLRIVLERYPDTPAPIDEAHTLLVEYEGPERHAQAAEVARLVQEHAYTMTQPPVTMEGREEQEQLWKARKALLPATRSYRPNLKAPSLVNDVGMDPAHLADFIEDVEGIFDRHGLVAAIYGHAGSGNLHLRPLFDVDAPDLHLRMTRLTDDVYEALFKYDGTITAEHGMGRVRAPYLVAEWGETIVGYMRQIKAVFDPDDLLNPDVMLSERKLMDDVKVALA